MNSENLLTTIKQLKQEIAELKKAKQRLEYIINALPIHIYWLDKNNTFLGCNTQQAKTTGLKSNHEIIGKTIYDFQTKENTDIIIQNNNEIMTKGITKIIEEKAFLTNSHIQGTYLSYKSPLYDKNNNVTGLLGASFDITERKELEEKLKHAKEKADAANIAKTEFLANISHDVRTPISGIIGMTQILESRLKKSQNKLFVKNISESANQLLKILNEVIDFSKIETYRQPIHQNKFNLKDIIKDVIKSFSTDIKEKNIKIEVNYSPKSQYFIGDQIRIYRIFLNLVSNAVKFTESGNIYINISANEKKNNKVILKLEVSDTGIGIPNDMIPRIFEKFTRLSSSYKNVHQGSGLGLAIVKRFVMDMGGTIEVTSQINKGTTFTCLIPLKLTSKNLCETKFVFKKLPRIKETNKLNILLIEDDKTCQLSQQILLADMGHIVDTADSGTEAINLITKPYELIITDIGLSDLDGYQLAKIIRKSDDNQLTPIIALTAHLPEENKTQCINSGINIVLHKPMNLEEIQRAIHTLTRDFQNKN